MLVLSDGKPVAQGRPSQVLANPKVSSIADLATLENLLEAEVISVHGGEGIAKLRIGEAEFLAPDVFRQAGEVVMASIRAGDIIIANDLPPKMSARNIIKARIDDIHVIGSRVLVYLDIGVRIMVEITSTSLKELELKEGRQVHLIIKTNSIIVLDVKESSGNGTSNGLGK